MSEHKCPRLCKAKLYSDGGCPEHQIIIGPHHKGWQREVCHADSRCDRRRYPWGYLVDACSDCGRIFPWPHKPSCQKHPRLGNERRAPDQVTERRQVERRSALGSRRSLGRRAMDPGPATNRDIYGRRHKDRRAKPAEPQRKAGGVTEKAEPGEVLARPEVGASASPSPARIAEIREKCARAMDMVSDLCTRKREWIMSIPARPDHDPDLIIAAALGEISDLLSAYDALAAENERLQAVADYLAGYALNHPDPKEQP